MPNAPRPNLPWDRIVGPGASRGETIAIIVAAALAVPLAAGAAVAAGPIGWQWWQWLLVLALAADLGGGMVANALPATKRWYHRGGRPEWRLIAFVAIHLHLPVLALALPGAISVSAAWLGYLWLVGGALALLAVPNRLRLGAAVALTLVGTVLVARMMPMTSAIGWMPLALMLKLLVGHMVAPEDE